VEVQFYNSYVMIFHNFGPKPIRVVHHHNDILLTNLGSCQAN
jgi:hypothetical protein